MPYTPPASNAVNFDDASTSYTPPAYNAVFFDDAAIAGITLPAAKQIALTAVAPTLFRGRLLALPSAKTVALAGVAPQISGGRALRLPAAVITFAGVAPSISNALSLLSYVRPHRTIGGGPAREGTLGYGHRMVLGGIAKEGGGGAHRSVIGGMEREGGSFIQRFNLLAMPTARQIALSGVAPRVVQTVVDGGSGHVLLYVPFTGNVSTDVGPQLLGDGMNTGASFSSNQFPLSGTTQQQIVFLNDTRLGQPTDTGWTLECFMVWNSSDNTTDPGLDLSYELYGPTDIIQERYFIHAYSNAGAIQLDLAAFGIEAQSADHVLSGSRQHVAMVRQPGSATIDVYVNGARVIHYIPGGSPSLGSKGLVSFGKYSTSAFNNISAVMDDIRLCNIAVYSGASFTPPTILASS